MPIDRVGLIGLGLMGSAMTERWIAAGIEVIGYDIEEEQVESFGRLGGKAVESAAAVCNQTSHTVFSLPTSQIALDVTSSLQPALSASQTIIDTTTGHPDEMIAIGRQFSEVGVHYLDATVSGSSDHVRRGQATVMVGGDTSVAGEVAPLFDCFAEKVYHVGPIGSGACMKLVTNLVLGLNRAALAEGLFFAESIGLDAVQSLEVLMNCPAYSRIMDTKGTKMIERDFAPQARLTQHLKDVQLILGLAEHEGNVLPLSAAHQKLLETAQQIGYGDKDNSAVIQALRERDTI